MAELGAGLELDGGIVVSPVEVGFDRPSRSVAGVLDVLGVLVCWGLGLASCLFGSETDGDGVSMALFLFWAALASTMAAVFSLYDKFCEPGLDRLPVFNSP